ncbi:nucleotidyl transferase AbiEii/AbiGii toxin family protein [Thalassovita sp.]|uniref:nucleotidyl transferase AbiEii/AbiGii toxin family protein n=1 Tax=Thalassovita sp. TaxID=1979401 RepID=UPI002B270365|nr:nucleotidyl transferase AbiEii/AbiGii toxin family protein [Thalassovita sp.]
MTFEEVSFRRDHHNAILNVLRSLDGDFLAKTGCYFGGGTAIVLALDEYRESVDIDFLCATQDGYRTLRNAIAGQPNLNNILRPKTQLECVREVRANQYGLRTVVQSQGANIKFEIVREVRIDLQGELDARYGLPILSRPCMYAEKLLANSDRWYAPEVASRDILDLSVMISRWGPIPKEAWGIAEAAYGNKVREDFGKAIDKIRHPEHIESCAKKMQIESAVVEEVLRIHGGAYEREPSPYD